MESPLKCICDCLKVTLTLCTFLWNYWLYQNSNVTRNWKNWKRKKERNSLVEISKKCQKLIIVELKAPTVKIVKEENPDSWENTGDDNDNAERKDSARTRAHRNKPKHRRKSKARRWWQQKGHAQDLPVAGRGGRPRPPGFRSLLTSRSAEASACLYVFSQRCLAKDSLVQNSDPIYRESTKTCDGRKRCFSKHFERIIFW